MAFDGAPLWDDVAEVAAEVRDGEGDGDVLDVAEAGWLPVGPAGREPGLLQDLLAGERGFVDLDDVDAETEALGDLFSEQLEAGALRCDGSYPLAPDPRLDGPVLDAVDPVGALEKAQRNRAVEPIAEQVAPGAHRQADVFSQNRRLHRVLDNRVGQFLEPAEARRVRPRELGDAVEAPVPERLDDLCELADGAADDPCNLLPGGSLALRLQRSEEAFVPGHKAEVEAERLLDWKGRVVDGQGGLHAVL